MKKIFVMIMVLLSLGIVLSGCSEDNLGGQGIRFFDRPTVDDRPPQEQIDEDLGEDIRRDVDRTEPNEKIPAENLAAEKKIISECYDRYSNSHDFDKRRYAECLANVAGLNIIKEEYNEEEDHLIYDEEEGLIYNETEDDRSFDGYVMSQIAAKYYESSSDFCYDFENTPLPNLCNNRGRDYSPTDTDREICYMLTGESNCADVAGLCRDVDKLKSEWESNCRQRMLSENGQLCNSDSDCKSGNCDYVLLKEVNGDDRVIDIRHGNKYSKVSTKHDGVYVRKKSSDAMVGAKVCHADDLSCPLKIGSDEEIALGETYCYTGNVYAHCEINLDESGKTQWSVNDLSKLNKHDMDDDGQLKCENNEIIFTGTLKEDGQKCSRDPECKSSVCAGYVDDTRSSFSLSNPNSYHLIGLCVPGENYCHEKDDQGNFLKNGETKCVYNAKDKAYRLYVCDTSTVDYNRIDAGKGKTFYWNDAHRGPPESKCIGDRFYPKETREDNRDLGEACIFNSDCTSGICDDFLDNGKINRWNEICRPSHEGCTYEFNGVQNEAEKGDFVCVSDTKAAKCHGVDDSRESGFRRNTNHNDWGYIKCSSCVDNVCNNPEIKYNDVLDYYKYTDGNIMEKVVKQEGTPYEHVTWKNVGTNECYLEQGDGLSIQRSLSSEYGYLSWERCDNGCDEATGKCIEA